mgnify:CR=1 FL=1|jgi:hypothetical protein
MPILKVRRAPDQYNGDLDCIDVLSQHYLCADFPAPEYPGDGPAPHGHYTIIVPDDMGLFAAYAADLYEWYGSNGEGNLAAQEIIVRPGWQLEWLPNPEN